MPTRYKVEQNKFHIPILGFQDQCNSGYKKGTRGGTGTTKDLLLERSQKPRQECDIHFALSNTDPA